MAAAVLGSVQGLVMGFPAADTTIAVSLLLVIRVVVSVDKWVVGPEEGSTGLVRVGHQRW